MNFETVPVGLIDLIRWFRRLTGLGLGDSKRAVEEYISTMKYERGMEFKFNFFVADITLFMNFCSLFTRNIVEMREDGIYPLESKALSGQALRDTINAYIPNEKK